MNFAKGLSILSLAGAWCLIVAGFAVPVFVPPPSIFAFNLDSNLTILAKWLLLQWLSGGAICLGALALLGPEAARYRSRVALPVAALGAWLVWAAISIFVNPASAHFIGLWLAPASAGVAVLLAPVLLTTERRCLLLLAGVMAASLIVSLIGVASSLGVSFFLKFLYGLDLAMLQDGRWNVQGGARSAAAMSTLANPEYAGTYTSAMICLWAVILLDGGSMLRRAGNTRGAWILRGIALTVLPLLLLHVVFTGSRQALITVVLLGMLRLLVALGVPLRRVAMAFCGYVLGMVFLGLMGGVLVLVVCLGAILAMSFRSGAIQGLFRGTDRFNLAVVVGLPTVVLVLGMLYSIPGPWNPTGLRLYERFSSLMSSQDDSYKERLVMFTLASRMATENPLLGVGPGRYRAEFFRTYGTVAKEDHSGALDVMRDRMGLLLGEQSHNDFLQISAETGIVGICLFLIAMLSVLHGLVAVMRESEGLRRFLAIAFLIGIGAFLSLMQTSFPLHMPSRAAVFWVLMAGAVGLIAQPKTSEK